MPNQFRLDIPQNADTIRVGRRAGAARTDRSSGTSSSGSSTPHKCPECIEYFREWLKAWAIQKSRIMARFKKGEHYYGCSRKNST